MEREQFTFYASFFRAVSRIKNKASRCDAYDAICSYALSGTHPDLDKMSDAAAIAFELSKPNLDASRRKAENGKIGGSSKQNGSKNEAKQKQEETGTKKESKKEKENECYTPHTPQRGDDAFERFWLEYPNKSCGKSNALKSWKKIKHTPELDAEIMSGLSKQKCWPQWTKESGQFVPMATTWLNQHRWDAEGSENNEDDYWHI